MKIYITSIILVLGTTIGTFVITKNTTQKLPEPTPTQTTTPLVTPVHESKSIYKPVQPVQKPVQDTVLKIEQCKVQAQMLAKKAAQDWFVDMLPQINNACSNDPRSDCIVKWTKSFSDNAKNLEENLYFQTAYSSCLNKIQ